MQFLTIPNLGRFVFCAALRGKMQKNKDANFVSKLASKGAFNWWVIMIQWTIGGWLHPVVAF
jgi:hypothetical protein